MPIQILPTICLTIELCTHRKRIKYIGSRCLGDHKQYSADIEHNTLAGEESPSTCCLSPFSYPKEIYQSYSTVELTYIKMHRPSFIEPMDASVLAIFRAKRPVQIL